MFFVEKVKKYILGCQLYFKAIFLIIFFIIASSIVLFKTGLTDEIAKIFYWPQESNLGQVAGEYMVSIAAVGDAPDLEPAYPRIVFGNPNGSEHVTSICTDYLSKFNLVAIVDRDNNCVDKVKEKNPDVIALGNWGSLEDANFPSNAGSFGYHIFNYNAPQITTPIHTGTTDIGIFNADVDTGFPRWEVTPGSGNYPYGRTGSSIFIVGPNKQSGVISYTPDRISYSSVDEDNKILEDVGGIDDDHVANSYIRMPIKFVGWAPNVTTVNPYGGDNAINYYLSNKYTAERLVNASHFDGIWYDQKTFGQDPQFWARTDFDMNWQDDAEQWGEDGKIQRWYDGLKNLFTQEKQKTGLNIIITNDGMGAIPLESITSWHNGFMAERCMYGFWNWQLYFDALRDWDLPDKIIICYDGLGTWSESKLKNYKNKFKDMRLGLAMNTMGPGYYGRSVLAAYELALWYDEFDVDLGQPTGEPLKIISQCNSTNGRCPYVRFFDNGAVIVNHTLRPVTISQNDLIGLANYDGPYFRFYGGQDSGFNNGKPLAEEPVTLDGVLVRDGYDKENSGDGIVLVNMPNYYAVSDILVGNANNNDTSPASEPVVLSGTWDTSPPVNAANPYYSQWDNNDEAEGIGYFSTTDSNATATFTPNIGVAGEYEVFEWHGWAGNSAGGEATNVRAEIKNAEGVENITINQRQNYGMWNSLGKFNFRTGKDGYVKISAASADGAVLADVIKFVYTNNNVGPVVTEKILMADLNCDHKVDIIDFGMLLSCWSDTIKISCISQSLKDAGCSKAPDLNSDNKVDMVDIAIMLGCWGKNINGGCAMD